MTTIVLAALVLAVLVSQHLDNRRRDLKDAALRADLASDRRQWVDERRELLNRIKPETAQFTPVTDAAPARRVPFDDDDAFHLAVDPLAVSKEELAEMDAALDIRDLTAGIAAARGGAEA